MTTKTTPTVASTMDGDLLGYTCSQCGASMAMRLTADQIEAITHFGLRKLRPNICPTCEAQVVNPRMSHTAHQEAESAPSMPREAYLRWIGDKQALAVKYGPNYTIRDNIAARIASKMLWVAKRKAGLAGVGKKENKGDNRRYSRDGRQRVEMEEV